MYRKFILFLTLIFTQLISNYAGACSGPRYTGKAAFENAKRVFRAKILQTELVFENYEGSDYEIINSKYELLEVYKGNVSENGIVKTIPFFPGNCSVALLTGSEYVIYLGEDDFVYDFNGTWGYLDSEIKKTAEELREIKSYASKDM